MYHCFHDGVLYLTHQLLKEILYKNVCFVNSKSDTTLYNYIGAELIAKAIVEGVTGKKINDNVNTGFYQVVTGSFSNKEYAVIQQNKLKELGISSFLQWRGHND